MWYIPARFITPVAILVVVRLAVAAVVTDVVIPVADQDVIPVDQDVAEVLAVIAVIITKLHLLYI